MKPTEDQWTRWIDGDLSEPEETEMLAMVRDDAALQKDRDFFRHLSRDLRRSFPKEQAPPFPDFFNSQIQKRLREEVATESRAARVFQWPAWFSWAFPLGAAAAIALTASQLGFFGGSRRSEITSTYTPDDGVLAETTYYPEAQATVVRMTGIEPLPDGFRLTVNDIADLFPVGGEEPGLVSSENIPEGRPPFRQPKVQFTSFSSAY